MFVATMLTFYYFNVVHNFSENKLVFYLPLSKDEIKYL